MLRFLIVLCVQSLCVLQKEASAHGGCYMVVIFDKIYTVNQQILAAIKFGVSQNKVIYVNLADIKFGVSPRPVYAVYDRRIYVGGDKY